MVDISDKVLRKIAGLAHIKVSDKDLEWLGPECEKIISWAEHLNEVDTENIKPMMAVERDLRMREDEVKTENTVDEVLKNSPDRQYDFFAVPKFIDQD